ncbi:MAG: beta-N-acetylhexosaminidase, partial [Proteobacteria bacterium]|nr:beta-N-acetylhexosaminidase [Pseudomonadota bacterium]
GPTLAPSLAAKLDRGEVGATILFKRNLVMTSTETNGIKQELCDLDALARLTHDLHRTAPDGTPALVAIDHEGGTVQRVRAPATHWPPMLQHAALAGGEDVAVATQVGRAIGDELRALGIDIDFAPILDVHTNAANPIIGERAFGTDPEGAARRALAFARGLDAAGVLGCGKHFPGHGDTTTDSHLELPRIDHDWARLEAIELLPFRRAAAANLPMIMTAHVVFAAIDPSVPATLSRAAITGVLRDKLDYRGVIVSDDLDMRAIAGTIGVDAAAIAAIRAGCDVLLLCRDEAHQDLVSEALTREVERDPAFAQLVATAAARVRAMKRAHAASLASTPAPTLAAVGAFEHRRLADRLAGRA